MTFSIRNFLLVNLLLAITITTSLTVVGNYYLDQQDIQNHLDTLLSQAALSFQVLIGDELTDQELRSIQNGLNAIPSQAQNFFNRRGKYLNYAYQDKYQFQAWNDKGQLILHSANAPTTRLGSGAEGFSDTKVHEQLWRVFSTYNPKLKMTIVVAERYAMRNELAHRITQDDIYILLMIFPLSGLLIWLIIGRGLSSLNRIAKEVSQRASTYLEPVHFKVVPVEIQPLIKELNQLFLRLKQAFEREQRFAADAAHELRTPLAALKTQAQVALKSTDSKERENILENLINGVDRSAHVVQQLLTLSRLIPEVAKIEDLTEVNLAKLSAEVLAQLVPLALDKHIDIELSAPDQNLMLVSNIAALSILVRNLVDNAIRYTPEHGAIKVSILADTNTITLRVMDNGPGIPAEHRSRVFERFFRVLGNKSPGSGLGLAIVQQIAQLHHAEVRLSAPEIGTGLIVDVIFPRTISNSQ